MNGDGYNDLIVANYVIFGGPQIGKNGIFSVLIWMVRMVLFLQQVLIFQ